MRIGARNTTRSQQRATPIKRARTTHVVLPPSLGRNPGVPRLVIPCSLDRVAQVAAIGTATEGRRSTRLEGRTELLHVDGAWPSARVLSFH